jgi:hypothetical protein
MILINGNVRTFDKRNPRAEAVAVSNGRIIAVGNNASIKALTNAKTIIIDAKGKLVLPGFNDAHVHLTGIGNLFSHLDLRAATDQADVIRRLSDYGRVLPKGRWIIGAGISLDKSPITLKALDDVSPDNPLLLYLSDTSSALVNSAALRAARISLNSRGTSHGGVVRAEDGKPTGVVAGTAVAIVRNAVPRDHSSNWSEIIETASNYAASLGVTSVQDVHSDDLAVSLRQLALTGSLKTRVYDCIGLKEWQKLVRAGVKAASGDSFVRAGCVKGNARPDQVDPEDLKLAIADPDKAGLQVMIHAIGERANENALYVFESVAARNGKRDRRFRIEHSHRMKSGDIARLSPSAIIASMQPHLFLNGGDDYRAIFKSGVRIAFGSDASITDFNPLLGIHAAINGDPARSLTVEEAVGAYTLGSAYAEFQEKEKGSIEKGKLADLVVLSDDIFTIAPSKIDKVKVLTTVVNGRIVFDATSFDKVME